MSATIRVATPADAPAVLDLVEELFDPPGRRPPDYTRERGAAGIHTALQRPDADVLVAVEGERLVGFASVYVDFLSIRFGWRCWLQDLVVTAARRSTGVGQRLLDVATGWARARGCTHLELSSATTRRDAHRFYLAAGMAQGSLCFSRRIG